MIPGVTDDHRIHRGATCEQDDDCANSAIREPQVITTLIFDLDGTLADTERLHCLAYQQALGEFGVDISDKEYDEHWIRRGLNIDEFVAARGLDIDPDVIRRDKAVRFGRLARTEAKPMPGVHAALEALRDRRRLVLATSSHRDAAAAVLDTLALAGCFEYIATKENATRVKPAPDVHLHVMDTVGLTPGECLVVEDAEKGVRAAAAAGIRCVAVPNPHTADHDFSQATRVLASLSELTPDLIDRLE
jgi:HAD superfamily hydrolase (TIGR01509 family)